MTRKDYRVIAAALAVVRPNRYDDDSYDLSPAYRTWAATRDSMADALAEDNPRFDRDLFVAACEGELIGRLGLG